MRELNQEGVAYLQPHQAEMSYIYWALIDLGINMLEEEDGAAGGARILALERGDVGVGMGMGRGSDRMLPGRKRGTGGESRAGGVPE